MVKAVVLQLEGLMAKVVKAAPAQKEEDSAEMERLKVDLLLAMDMAVATVKEEAPVEVKGALVDGRIGTARTELRAIADNDRAQAEARVLGL